MKVTRENVQDLSLFDFYTEKIKEAKSVNDKGAISFYKEKINYMAVKLCK